MNDRQTALKRRHLYLTMLVSGMTTLAVELSASRLLGALFGTSNVVWVNIIGLILIYLAVGYFIGGKWADHSPTAIRFYQIVAWGAFFSGLAPLVAHLLLPVLASIGLPLGLATAASIFALFAIPVTLLGCVPPFAIRLALTSVEQAGRVAGRMYAVSTLGSVLGGLAPVLYMLPEVGTTVTFLIFAELLLLVALLGMALYDRQQCLRFLWMPVVHVLIGLLV